MASPQIEAKRAVWREGFDPRAPLAEQLDWPFTPAWQVAHVMGVSESSVYAQGIRFDALMRSGDRVTAARYVPCLVLGRSKRFPTQAFISWWESAGAVTLRALMDDAAREAVVSV
ncbi:MAG: hypothetical protein QM323_11690 [Acidobacteriota bacterium]|jgi:hypothetical protein|nr:hypothetical protein [Acidobacteriota bacterium]